MDSPSDRTEEVAKPDQSFHPARIRRIGPGLVMAATGIGAGDLVVSIVIGTKYGLALLWALVLGVIIKYYMVEAVGRWHLATGETVFQGWRRIGAWTTWFIGIYYVVWAFVVGAAIPYAAGLGMHALWPILSSAQWATVNVVVAFLLAWFGHYRYFELVMKVLLGVLFVTVVCTASMIFAAYGSRLPSAFSAPSIDQLPYILGIIGGIGGSLSLMSYGYWMSERKWRGPAWLPMMRLDAITGFTITGIFAVSVLIMGAAFLFGSGMVFDDNEGLIRFAEVMEERLGLGPVPRIMFLIGFWAAPFTSFLGGMQGVSYIAADVFEGLRRNSHSRELSVSHPAYRASLIWFTFPPIVMYYLSTPVAIVIAFAIIGAVFMPFVSGTMLYLLNSRAVPVAYRSNWRSNGVLTFGLVLFATLCVLELGSYL